MLPLKLERELQTFLCIINYLGKFSPNRAKVCELLRSLTLVELEWRWNVTYQTLFETTKAIVKEDVCMHEVLQWN